MARTTDEKLSSLSSLSSSRRTFIKRMVLIGASAPTIATLLAACGDDDDDDTDEDPADETDDETDEDPDDEDDTSDEPDDEDPDEDDEDDEPAVEASEGGTVRHLIYEDPDTMNFVIGGTSIGRQVYQTIVEGLVYVDTDGNFQPLLATEIPTEENGGITNDGLTITWHLKEGVTWHDGEPFTADDVIFTYEAAMSDESIHTAKFEKIESIEAPDDHTVVINYRELDVGYLEAWRGSSSTGIIPRHATGELAEISAWDFNRHPIGTGPFMMQEWAAGDHVTVVRNDNYHEEGKPHLDQIHFLIVPSEETRAQMMIRGDGEIMLWPGSNYNQDFENSGVVSVEVAPGVWNCRFMFNMSMPFDDDPGPDPPHPFLGDQDVRHAITLAVDRHRISEEILEGDQVAVASPWPIGWYAAELDDYDHDKDQARQMLEDAGWVEGGGGIREASGAPNADDGHRAEIGLSTYAAFLPMELTALAIQEDLADVGIGVNVSIEDFAVIFGGWADGAPRKVGDFDSLMYDTSVGGVEPHATIRNTWHSASIPSAENPGGDNVTRFNEPEADELLDAAGATLDFDERARLYQEFAEIEREVRPIVYIFQFQEGNAYSNRLQNYVVSTWEWSTWDAKEWTLADG